MSLPALDAVHHKVEELNKPGKLPPGMKVQKFDDRTNLVPVLYSYYGHREPRHGMSIGH
jgi:hypothetical protein